jgi:hypothetical protein
LEKDISFNVDIGLTNNTEFTGQEDITISLIEDDSCLYGQKVKRSNSLSKIINFKDLTISCTGNFTFKANGGNFSEGVSKEVPVKQNYKKVIIASGSVSVSVGRNIAISVSVLGTLDDSPWPQDLNMTLYSEKEDDSFRCERSKNFIIKAGNVETFNCYPQSKKNNKIIAQVVGEPTKASLEVDVESTLISIPSISEFLETSQKVTSDQTFWVAVQLQISQNGINQDVTDANLRVYLDLYCLDNEDDCKGTKINGGGTRVKPVSTSGGKYNFTQVKILSQGEFYICAFDADESLDDPNYGCYGTLIHTTNKVGSLKVNVNETKISAYQKFNVTVEIKGEDGRPYKNNATVKFDEVISNRRYLLGGDVNNKVTNFKEAEIYFEGYGKRQVRAQSGSVIGYSKTISVEGIKIKITNFSDPLPETVRDPFEFDVYLSYANGDPITEIDIPIEISTSPSSTYEGVTEYKVKNGHAHISEFYVKSGGSYRIKVTAGGNSQKSSSKYNIEGIDCDIGYGPLIAMILLLVLGVIFPCFIMTVDSKQKSFNYIPIKVLAIHPLSGLCYKQPNYRRSLLMMQMATCELLMLTLIGAIYGYYDTPTTHYNRNFDDYKNSEVYKGATGWALSQIVAIPLFYFNFKAAESVRTGKITAGVMLLLMGLSTGAIIGMTIKYCLGYFVFWIINFMVFLLFDFFFVQIVYSFLCLCFMSRMIRGEMEAKPKKSQKMHLAEESEENSNKL